MSIDMSQVQLRTFSFEIEDVELIREAGGDGREITGIAVPYGVEQFIQPGLVERFDMGAFAHQIRAMHRVPLARGHQSRGGTVIGRLLSGEEIKKGLRIKARVSQMRDPIADDTLTFLNDDVLRELSIGFVALSRDEPDKRGVTVRKKAHLTELAIEMNGAYGSRAAVSSIRSAGGDQAETDTQDAALQALAALPLPDMIG